MTFDEVLAQVQELLQQEKRVSYRGLKRRFALDDEYLEDLKEELIGAKRLATDEDGRFLVWTGGTTVPKDQLPVASPSQPPAPQTSDSGLRTPDSKPQTLAASRQTLDSAAERRQLTVMFCDLVGSTALSTQLDPEELREVVRAYQETCTEVIRRYDGQIAQHLGDGLLVYFGYPAAHEDDAQRAVRAGLEIVEALQGQGTRDGEQIRRQPLQVRIGIHTGLVVIGEIGSTEKREILAMGETPNIAARIQGLAEPDSVVVSAATQRLVAGLFEYQDLGPQALKGITLPLSLYRVVQESKAQSRFEVAVSTGLTPLVGRDLEVGLLRERWTQAKGGEGQVILLSGEAGIGKSRLAQTLKEQVMAEGATRIECRCSPYHQNSAFYPIIEHLQRLLQFAREDAPQTKLTKLQHALLAYRFPQADTLSLLAALLSLPHPEGVPPLTLSPEKQKQKTQEALVAWMVEEAERQAVYCAWEDLHWADPSTLEFLTLFLDQVPTTQLLALLTFRPDFVPPWRPHSHITQLTLNRLGRPQVGAMIEKITGGKSLPREVVQQIVAKTDGVPLFVEELTKMLLESGLLTVAEGHYELRGPLPPLAIPSTLHDSLMARLDRLATTKEIAQVGATLGREFSYELLHAVSPLDEATLQQGLRQLVEAELVYQRGVLPQATYLFKHALVQDTAYQSLLKSKRQQYHQQVAHVLEQRFPETTETQPELLAHHYTEAGLIAQALPYWQQAGERASQRSAYVEATHHCTQGLGLLPLLPETADRTQSEVLLQTLLGNVLSVTKGMAAPEVGATLTRAHELCQRLADPVQLFNVLTGLRGYECVRGETRKALAYAEQLLQVAQRAQDSGFLLQAHMALGVSYHTLGEFTLARKHTEQGIRLYDPQHHRPHALRYSYDPKMVCLFFSTWSLWSLGYPDQAGTRSQELLTFARELSHPYSLAAACFGAGCFQIFRREESQALAHLAEAISLCTEYGMPLFLAYSTAFQGQVLVSQGNANEGLRQIQEALTSLDAMGVRLFRSAVLAYQVEGYAELGQVDVGLSLLAQALEFVDKHDERLYEAELYRIRGELTLQKFQVPGAKFQAADLRSLIPAARTEAEDCFLKAIEIAQRQQAKSLELRAAMSLSRLWQQQDEKEAARQLLAESYGWFTEGFDTKDLQEAKALLEELS